MQERSRGPSPDDPDEQLTHLSRLIAEAAANATVNIQNYREGGGGISSERALLKWILGVVGMLLVAAITGIVVGYGNMRSLQTIAEDHQRQLDAHQHAIERIVDRLEGRSGITRGEAAHDASSP